jgi:hypothetical protein
MSAHYFSEEGLRAVEDYGDEIRKQLKLIKPYFESVLQPIVTVEVDTHKLQSQLDVSLRFQANTPAILDILIEGVYQRTDVFLRELVQNALDACHLKSARAMRRADDYSPRILISLLTEDRKLKEIRVDDNGIGMDVHDVQDTVLWIGNSIGKRGDVKTLLKETTQKNLIATFGIGLLSCFKAARKVSVRSAKENSDPVEFSITSIKNDIKPAPSRDTSIGTTFVIDLKDEVRDELNLEDAAKHYFRMVRQAPIKLLKLAWSEKNSSHTRDEMFRIASTEGRDIPVEQIYEDDNRFCTFNIKGEDYVAWLWFPKCSRLEDVPRDEGRLTILSEGVFVTNDDSSSWLPKHFENCHGVINFAAKAVDLPVSRDKVVDNKKSREKRHDVAQRSLAMIDEFVKRTSSTHEVEGDLAALILSQLYANAEESVKEKVIRRMDSYQIKIFPHNKREFRLSEVLQRRPDAVYIIYPHGRFVSELCEFNGKQLYHKPDDFADLQAALFRQEGQDVISTVRCDSDPAKLLEADLIKSYFAKHSIKAVDLTKKNWISNKYRSKSVPRSVREGLSQGVKFVEIAGLPNKRSWMVGDETWINVANAEMERLYDLLVSGTLGTNQLLLAKLLIDLSACRFEESVANILRQLK